MNYDVIIAAAGSSTRSNLTYNKVLYRLNDEYVINKSIFPFDNDNRCKSIIIVCKEDEIALFKEVVKSNKVIYAIGGNYRQDSIKNGLLKVTSNYVLVHDGARPYLSSDLVNRVVDGLNNHNAIIPAINIVETIKKVVDGKVITTIDRDNLYTIQTPQGFKTSLLKDVYNKANDYFTDDASLVERYSDEDVYIVLGDNNNIKLTNKEDFRMD